MHQPERVAKTHGPGALFEGAVVKGALDVPERVVSVGIALARVALRMRGPVEVGAQHKGVTAAVLLFHSALAAVAIPMHLVGYTARLHLASARVQGLTCDLAPVAIARQNADVARLHCAAPNIVVVKGGAGKAQACLVVDESVTGTSLLALAAQVVLDSQIHARLIEGIARLDWPGRRQIG